MMPRGLAVTRPGGVFRPVQYLGSKLRALDDIARAVDQGSTRQVVWEPFTGSSVVAQSLAAKGHRVIAGDALAASSRFAASLLGVARGDQDGLRDASTRVAELTSDIAVPTEWAPFLRREREAIEAGDGAALLALDAALPQSWRSVSRTEPTGLLDPAALLSDVYAGTYFGLQQSIRLERIRAAIGTLVTSRGLSPWEEAGLLTALCSAASQAVFSAGKHFAQPHRISGTKNLAFHARRVIADRSVDIDETFAAAAATIEDVARPAVEGHRAYQGPVEGVTVDALREWGVTTVYADPPYTAQQYSRFYHILETLTLGRRPRLETRGGSVTRGLYPTDRYKSPFCSRRAAPRAFADFARLCALAGTRLVLSYSGSPPGTASGNLRSVSMEELIGICADAYGARQVEVIEVGYGYRQFNRTDVEVPGRQESEYLIIGERTC